MHYTGARILIEALIEEGVDTVFGYPGGAVLFIYDELFKHKDRIRHILVSHEQHAAHAADGYARSTGKVGVCIATSGPGATNLVTGIAAAAMDSVPLVAITGNVSTSLLGKDSFQEVDITGITMPIVKHNWIVKDVNEIAEVVREAFIVAQSSRPGPVLIDIPKDITSASGNPKPSPALQGRSQRLAERNKRITFTEEDIARAAGMLAEAKRPLLYAGGGVIISQASDELRLLAEGLHAPVALSLMGIGSIPKEHPLHTGLIGMHGTVASNKAVQRADLLVAIGARFSDRVTSSPNTFAKEAKILHFDIDPAEINKNIQAETWVIGDIRQTLREVLARLPNPVRTEWNGEIEEWKTQIPETHKPNPPGLHPRFILEETAKRLGKTAIVATDVGQHQIWTAQFYPFSQARSFLSSGGLGAMGYGLGAALGARVGNPAKPVVLFTGDGSFRMNCAELATLKNYQIPVLVIIFNNHVLGMVRQWQRFFYDKRYSESILKGPPDFVKLAQAYGLEGYSAQDEESFIAALDKASGELACGRGAVIDACLDQDEQVLPMVPGGMPLDEQIL
ncbi:MAG: biosynthetic-type acetolactate synthase large subunit [Spirochaetaceae bacterium]|jgi:acetolactate synthase-1/2/3 large subunit|nr:biosynthetic-type acetolactate synthase large subunit [Spirochaetaceae bacterium]